MNTIEVLFTPAEFAALVHRDLSQTVCVVFDILRATSSMITALANGAREIVPVAEISEALAIRKARPQVLLAGERDGLRIRADLTGSVDFDLGNSPREFTAEKVAGKSIAITTTNGTRALRACAKADTVYVGSFLNLGAIATALLKQPPSSLLLVCSGTHEEASYEDTLACGALSDLLLPAYASGHVADSVQIARQIYQQAEGDLLSAIRHARNGRRLLEIPELAADVPFCLQRDTTTLIARMGVEGNIRIAG
jgi:2-phosphosulfolactate phosphatase